MMKIIIRHITVFISNLTMELSQDMGTELQVRRRDQTTDMLLQEDIFKNVRRDNEIKVEEDEKKMFRI